jgi:Kef-type K+ transport system membrane component KefB/nucleotide-binding universal stress UspA family protein
MTPIFTAPPHHDVLVLVVQLAILLLTARVLGEFFLRLGQPTVVGEILAGILLGPSFISGLFPTIGAWIVPHTPVQGYLLETVSLLGVLFLMLLTGLETDIPLMRRQLRSAIGVAVGGLILPLVMGYLLGEFLPDNLLAKPDQRPVFSLFLATSMSISAIPVIAKVLMDLNLTRRDIGQVIIASAMIDDTVGWLLLSIVAALAGGAVITVGTVAQSVLSVLGFMLLSFTVGRWFVRWAITIVQNDVRLPNKMLSFSILLMFIWGAISLALGLEALLGAFIVGIILGQMRGLPSDVIHTLERVALGIFAPIFFAVAGLKVNALALLNPELFVVAILVISIATFCKVVGVYVGARVIGKRDHWTALFFGAGLNARGSMEIIVATIGLNLGVLTQEMFSVIVVMAVTTSLMAPFILRYTLHHIQPDEQELQRLRQEEINRANIIANVHRILLPVRPRAEASPVQTIEARILSRLSKTRNFQVTVISVVKPEDRPQNTHLRQQLGEFDPSLKLNKKMLVKDRPENAILDEAKRDYDLMIIGATEGKSTSEVLFTPITDYLIRLSPCPVVIVSGRGIPPDWSPKRILVPTNGSQASRRGAELAFALANKDSDEVYIFRVAERNLNTNALQSGQMIVRQMAIARQSVDELLQIGDMQSVMTIGDIQIGTEPEKNIMDYARQKNIDLIIIGTSVATHSDKLYLGPRVERILRDAHCPVLVINA